MEQRKNDGWKWKGEREGRKVNERRSYVDQKGKGKRENMEEKRKRREKGGKRTV